MYGPRWWLWWSMYSSAADDGAWSDADEGRGRVGREARSAGRPLWRDDCWRTRRRRGEQRESRRLRQRRGGGREPLDLSGSRHYKLLTELLLLGVHWLPYTGRRLRLRLLLGDESVERSGHRLVERVEQRAELVDGRRADDVRHGDRLCAVDGLRPRRHRRCRWRTAEPQLSCIRCRGEGCLCWRWWWGGTGLAWVRVR